MYLLLPLGRLSRPLNLLLMALTYVLGTGIARYLGVAARPQAFWLGLLGVLFAQMTMGLLRGAFQIHPGTGEDGVSPGDWAAIRDTALYLSIAALAACAIIAFILFRKGDLRPPVLVGAGASLLIILAYAVPPLRLLDRGFGELLLAIHIAYLGPSIGFLLQAGTYHLLLNSSILPLTLLLLATYLVLDFPSYAEDFSHKRETLLLRLGWENAIRLHHGLLLAAYLLLGSSMLFGYSFTLLAPAFLTIPFAVLQWHFLRNIAKGAKPVWSLLTANAVAVFGLTTYFLALSFWLR
jgi:1,4-dihydroxy-2-naphthoate octaprenyltransferase